MQCGPPSATMRKVVVARIRRQGTDRAGRDGDDKEPMDVFAGGAIGNLASVRRPARKAYVPGTVGEDSEPRAIGIHHGDVSDRGTELLREELPQCKGHTVAAGRPDRSERGLLPTLHEHGLLRSIGV